MYVCVSIHLLSARSSAPPLAIRTAQSSGLSQERGLQINRDHDRHPDWIEGAAINYGPNARSDDVNELEVVKVKSKQEQQHQCNQEDGDLIAYKDVTVLLNLDNRNQSQESHPSGTDACF
tara:strand:- start:179 stop:538 length:360 start_codon:yes stop_codon:yes gene_type:complete